MRKQGTEEGKEKGEGEVGERRDGERGIRLDRGRIRSFGCMHTLILCTQMEGVGEQCVCVRRIPHMQEIQELQAQVGDLMFYLDTQKKVASATDGMKQVSQHECLCAASYSDSSPFQHLPMG